MNREKVNDLTSVRPVSEKLNAWGHPRSFPSASEYPESATPNRGANGSLCGTGRSCLNYSEATDDQLVEAAKAGDQQAFSKLCERHSASVRRRLFRILGNLEDADDTLQESLAKAYIRLHQFRQEAKFSTWLVRIAINSALMHLRKRRSRAEVSFQMDVHDESNSDTMDFPSGRPSAEEVYAEWQTKERVERAIKGLPECMRCLVVEFYGNGRSVKDAAESVGISVAAAKSRLLRARLSLRSSLVKQHLSTFRLGTADRVSTVDRPRCAISCER